jgi:DNA-binding response OmpR family regulator
MTRQVLIVEDHADIRNLVALHLKDMDCQVTLAADGADGMSCARDTAYDLIVLDWMLPGVSGIDICRDVRKQKKNTPILMLTAKTEESDRVIGLDAGADDYVAKPFSVPEFRARVRAIFRRDEASNGGAELDSQQRVVRINELLIDAGQRLASIDDVPVDLTSKEFDLLLYLSLHPGRVFSRQQLLDAVWGDGFDGYEHTVNSHINRLRAKIEKTPAEPEHIVTVWGVGYKLSEYTQHLA